MCSSSSLSTVAVRPRPCVFKTGPVCVRCTWHCIRRRVKSFGRGGGHVHSSFRRSCTAQYEERRFEAGLDGRTVDDRNDSHHACEWCRRSNVRVVVDCPLGKNALSRSCGDRCFSLSHGHCCWRRIRNRSIHVPPRARHTLDAEGTNARRRGFVEKAESRVLRHSDRVGRRTGWKVRKLGLAAPSRARSGDDQGPNLLDSCSARRGVVYAMARVVIGSPHGTLGGLDMIRWFGCRDTTSIARGAETGTTVAKGVPASSDQSSLRFDRVLRLARRRDCSATCVGVTGRWVRST